MRAEKAEDSDPGMDDHRDAILNAVLVHVPHDGWTDAAVSRACADLKIDLGLAKLAFPGGVADLLEHFMRRADEQMMTALADKGVKDMRIRDRIVVAIRTRLEQNAEHRIAIRRAAGLLARPGNAELATRSLWRTVDAMWRAAGDTATDYNYYTKRVILSAVYSSTLLVWLSDKSEGCEETWKFLDHRIDDVMKFEKAKAGWLKARDQLPSLSRFLGRLRYPVE